jgi:hypothetical protein
MNTCVCTKATAVLQTFLEKYVGKKPIRPLVVTSIIVLNTTYWLSNVFSIVWTILLPFEIGQCVCATDIDIHSSLTLSVLGILGHLPLATTAARSMFWMIGAIVLRAPSVSVQNISDLIHAMFTYLSV